MLLPRGSCSFLVLFLFVCSIFAKPPPSYSPWSMYGKPVYARSLGPPMSPGMDTITVPYGPKTSPFFPKFVDPKMMISKKTDFLSNLFGGLGPVNYPMDASDDFPKFGPPKPNIYAREAGDESPDTADMKELFGNSEVKEENSATKEAKRGIFGSPKFGGMGSKFGAMGPVGPLGPFATPINPFASKFGPGYGYPFPGAPSKMDFDNSMASRKKRSISASETNPPTNLGPPPPYPGLGPISEEDEEAKMSASPKFYLPGVFGPIGPYGPVGVGPVVDPSIFISKKTAFLNALFSSLATSTPAPTENDIPTPKSTIVPPGFWSPFETTTEIPVPKSTIVPANFWLPSSIIPGPGEYDAKVATFLDKLFASIKLNKTKTAESDISAMKVARSLGLDPESPKTEAKRSIEDLQAITSAKDAIVDSIITELASLKTDMYNNLNDLVMAQKMAAASPMSKKPMKPMKAAFAGLFAPDYSLPFKQKMLVLSQVFDTLTGLQKNITMAVSDALKNSAMTTEAPFFDQYSAEPKMPSNYLFNVTLLDAVKGKLADLEKPKMATSAYQPPMPMWMQYAKAGAYGKGGAMKRHADRDYDQDDDVYENSQSDHDDQYKRAVKMSMHQGYQSMPPGTVESVQAGGGSVPGHQGGGIKLLDSQSNGYDDSNKWSDWSKYFDNEYSGHRHHHNHH